VVDKYTSTIVDVYAQRTGMTSEKIESLIANGDYWMTGAEAIELGFADETFDENENFQIAARIGDIGKEYHNIPLNLIPDTDEDPKQPKGLFQSLKSEIMDLKKHVTAFLDGLKGKTVDPKNENATVAIAELIAEPISAMVDSISAEFTKEIESIKNNLEQENASDTKDEGSKDAGKDGSNKDAAEGADSNSEDSNASKDEGADSAEDKLVEKVTNSISKSFEKRLNSLEEANKKLMKENDELKEEISNKLGGEGRDRNSGATEAKVIGSFSGKQ
jgi:hypothetical protein